MKEEKSLFRNSPAIDEAAVIDPFHLKTKYLSDPTQHQLEHLEPIFYKDDVICGTAR